ncbi:hypothetical protein VTH06DRAFT_1087 [Thermothelomyces fergusii]
MTGNEKSILAVTSRGMSGRSHEHRGLIWGDCPCKPPVSAGLGEGLATQQAGGVACYNPRVLFPFYLVFCSLVSDYLTVLRFPILVFTLASYPFIRRLFLDLARVLHSSCFSLVEFWSIFRPSHLFTVCTVPTCFPPSRSAKPCPSTDETPASYASRYVHRRFTSIARDGGRV